MSWLKRRLPKKRWKRVLVYLFSTLLILLAADMALVQYWRRITISPETTRITAPLTANGYPDYLASLNADLTRGLTAENNAAPFLVQFIPPDDDTKAWRKQVDTYFALPAAPAGPSPVVAQYSSWVAQHTPATSPAATARFDDETLMDRTPWRGTDHPLWKQWIDDHRSSLDLLHQACLRPRYYVPLMGPNGPLHNFSPESVIGASFPPLGHYRRLADLAVARAMMRLGDGDPAGFHADIMDTLRLSRLLSQGPTLVEKLVAVAIDALAQQAIQHAATSGLLNAPSAEKLQAALAALPPLTPVQESIDHGERYLFLDFVCVISQYGLAGYRRVEYVANGGPAPQHTIRASVARVLYPLNCNAMMREGNTFYDRCVEALSKPTYREQRAAFDSLDRDLQALKSRNILIWLTDPGSQLLAIFVPSFGLVARLQDQSRVTSALTPLSLRLRLYQLAHHAYPETLAQLDAPPALLNDGFVDRPLIYRRDGAGYLLYSVGPDGHDDGGKTYQETDNINHYDIVLHATR